MLKVLHRVLLVLLLLCIVGVGISAIIKSEKAIYNSDRVIAEADEFLRRYSHGR